MKTRLVSWFGKDDVEKYKDLTSLESANIAAQKGTVPETMVKEQLPKAQLTSLTNMGEAVNELQAGKVDAVHMDEPVALSYAAKKCRPSCRNCQLEDEGWRKLMPLPLEKIVLI